MQLKGGQTDLSTGSLPKSLQQPGAQSRSCSSLRALNYLSHRLLPLRVCIRKLELTEDPRHLDMGCRCLDQQAKHLLLAYLLKVELLSPMGMYIYGFVTVFSFPLKRLSINLSTYLQSGDPCNTFAQHGAFSLTAAYLWLPDEVLLLFEDLMHIPLPLRGLPWPPVSFPGVVTVPSTTLS